MTTSAEPAAEATSAVTTVLVVDDHTTFADLLDLALAGEPDLHCIGTAHRMTEALALADDLSPDVVLMDVRLGKDDGIIATTILTERHPHLRVMILTAHADSAVMHAAAAAGACALLPKDGSLRDMLQAVRTARRGALTVHPALLTAWLTKRSATRGVPSLTRREQEVLAMLAEGLDARLIAQDLRISLNTCRGYVKNILMKLQAHSQLEAVAIGRRNGMIPSAT